MTTTTSAGVLVGRREQARSRAGERVGTGLAYAGLGLLALVFAFRAARKALGVTPSAALKARLKADSEL